MNNGKVRIYELSKELNLDNRDILAVCDQLNISVKSHSSTITEAEAARIRSAAEKYTSSHPTSKPAVSASGSSRPSSPQPPVKKQQILEIRRNRPLVEPPKRPEAEAVAPAAKPTPAPQPPSEPPTQLTAPSRPAEATSQPMEEVKPQPPAETDSEMMDTEREAVEAAVEPETPQLPEPMAESSAPPVESEPVAASAELVPPPARPAEPTPPQAARPAAVSPSSVNRPILKRPRVAQTEPAARESRRPAEVGAAKEPPRRSEATSAEPTLKPKPVLELRRKPVRPGADSASEGEGTSKAASAVGVKPGESIVEEVRRPTLQRAPKRGKTWEEEDEEETEAQRAGKTGTKSKRRTPLIDDEEDIIDIDLDEVFEEEEDEEEEDENAPVQVSLSLARPPKPKSRPAAPKPPVVASPQRSKRGESRSFRRERRQEETRQRPEEIALSAGISVHDLAEALVVPETELIKILFIKGIAANINQILDIPTAAMVAQEYGVTVRTTEAEAEARKVTEMLDAEDLENLQRRPPVVTIMGHVDHGKTTLLDSIRKTRVAQGEAGGITQHIGAYHVDVEQEGRVQQVVFLDTPGHEAFTAMRARGARVTDVAVLVVAADDGVRPQTIEAISHAKAAGVPIIVAINKIDKEEAQPDRVKQELTEFGLVPEEWGGDTIMVPVSAIKGENLDALLEMILLVSEVEDLYANPNRPAKGTVIEAHLDKARGPVATLIVQNGSLRVGDVLVAGSAFGKVRAMVDDRGQRVEEASPSFAVEVLGLSDVPAAGDEFEVYRDEKEARAIAASRTDQQRQSRLQQAMASRRVSLNTLSAQAQEGELKELNLILKADVQGSVEAILGALQQLPQKEVQLRVLLAAPGEITETDVDLAAASSAVIVGFNTTFASGARQAADEAGVDVRDYNIIYKLLEDIQGAMEGLLEPEMVEEPLGQAEVRAVFPVGRGAVAGCYVQSGKLVRNCRVRVRRQGEVVFEGNLDSLKRMKDDVKEANAGYECGVGVDAFKDWEIGDIIEAFRLVSKRRTLSA
ncbi:MAG: translation initiation factor IF-2 [Synechococcales cyanobacterium C42_A2020_086]|nr:translation initiation factor IF-2 [Synechococcales cyanobacterium C42_A2020_086]